MSLVVQFFWNTVYINVHPKADE